MKRRKEKRKKEENKRDEIFTVGVQ